MFIHSSQIAGRSKDQSLRVKEKVRVPFSQPPFKVVNFLELVGEAMGVEKPDLFKQWKMMQDIDRNLAEVAAQAAAANLDLESVREVLLANMLGEQPLPIDFRAKPPTEPEAAPVRVISE